MENKYILYVLCINNLDIYVSKEKIKLLRKRDIKDNIDNYIPDKFDNSLVYDKGTSNQDIKNDVLVMWIITNSLGNNTKKKIIQSHNKTSFQIWNILRKSFTKS